jgi:hypothetical protein
MTWKHINCIVKSVIFKQIHLKEVSFKITEPKIGPGNIYSTLTIFQLIYCLEVPFKHGLIFGTLKIL